MTRLFSSAVLFDMDGTLVDSTAAVIRVWGGFADQRGLDVNEILATSHGVRMIDTLRRYVGEHELEAVDAELAMVEANDTEGIIPIPGAPDLLAAIAATALPLALVTSASVRLATRRMAAAGLTMPHHLVSGDDIANGKPHPDPYLEGARVLGANPASAVVFEDAEAGILSGLAAGATVVIVGDHESETTRGMLRVPDLTHVTVVTTDDGVALDIRD